MNLKEINELTGGWERSRFNGTKVAEDLYWNPYQFRRYIGYTFAKRLKAYHVERGQNNVNIIDFIALYTCPVSPKIRKALDFLKMNEIYIHQFYSAAENGRRLFCDPNKKQCFFILPVECKEYRNSGIILKPKDAKIVHDMYDFDFDFGYGFRGFRVFAPDVEAFRRRYRHEREKMMRLARLDMGLADERLKFYQYNVFDELNMAIVGYVAAGAYYAARAKFLQNVDMYGEPGLEKIDGKSDLPLSELDRVFEEYLQNPDLFMNYLTSGNVVIPSTTMVWGDIGYSKNMNMF